MSVKLSAEFNHSHKKRKDSLETQAKLAVLCTYIENQAILEPIFFTGHQNVNKPKTRAGRTFYGPIFLPFYKIIVSFFSFFYQDANKKIVRTPLEGGGDLKS